MDYTRGTDLVSPLDRMPPGSFPYTQNLRVLQEGRLESRPGYSRFNTIALSPASLHSIRRLNDEDKNLSPVGYTYIIGNGNTLWSGVESALAQIDSGYSGDPLSLITFRPEDSPESWMYVYDRAKSNKVNTAGTLRPIGYGPPTQPVLAEYGPPAWVQVQDGQATASWTFSGAASAVGTFDRTNGGTFTISQILYNAGSTGWCCIVPSAGSLDWTGERMQVVLNTGGTPEVIVVREIHPAIAATTISSIIYDSGATGLCSIVLVGSPSTLQRNSLIRLGGAETVRVLSVTYSADGLTYSIRCSTTGTRAAGNAVAGLVSWYVYTIRTHAAAETITSVALSVTQSAAGTGNIQKKVVEDALNTNAARPISITDDYLHLSLFFQNPANITSLTLQIDVDSSTPAGTAFTGNYYSVVLTQAQIGTFTVTSGDVWVDLTVPLSQLVRHGGDTTRNLSTVEAVGLSLITTAACSWGFDWWYNFGTYGPNVLVNAPTGLIYEARYRDSTTGAASVPGPPTRYELFPMREEVLITPPPAGQAGADSIDIYREGGTLLSFVFVGSLANVFFSPLTFADTASDTDLTGNPAPDLTLLQPWPVLVLPRSGFVNTAGTSVTLVSGSAFDLKLLAATVILINGVAYQTYGQPRTASFLEISSTAGTQTNVPYLIASPTLAAQPLPFAFGPLEGPLVPVVFALGDSVNAGTLYWTNSDNADAASDLNTLELCAPSEPLVSGAVWNGLVVCGSRDNIYLVRYSYLQTGQYQFNRIPSASGMWSRWSCIRGPDGVYFLGRDGVYKATETGAENISDALLYPLFPHDGQAALGANGIRAVKMDELARCRLTASDEDVYFDYIDIAGESHTLRYEITKKRWFPHQYGDSTGIVTHYLVEPLVESPNTMQLLTLSAGKGWIYLAGGNADDDTQINSILTLPAYDGGDERAQKLTVDFMTDLDGTGSVNVIPLYNNWQTVLPASTLTVTGSRVRPLINVASISNLALNTNISVRYAWTGGPAGPRIYAFEPSAYVQPYLSTSIVSQIMTLSYMGWKQHRRMYPGLISTGPVSLQIWTDDGRQFGPYTIPSTGGRFRVQPQMLNGTIKALAFTYSLTSDSPFAFFPSDFTIETKEWTEPDYLRLAVFKT